MPGLGQRRGKTERFHEHFGDGPESVMGLSFRNANQSHTVVGLRIALSINRRAN